MRNILITGASSGIGLQLAKDYARRGYRVYASARSEKKLSELSNSGDGEIIPVPVDVTSRETVSNVFSKLEKLDTIILNAGTCEYVDIEKFDSSLFERVFQVNFFGVVYSVEALLPKMKKGGQIAIVGSQARLLPFTRSEAYGSSKAAVDYFSKSLSVDLSERDITVHSIDPGFVKTPLTDKNDFSMPFLVTVEEASEVIIKSLLKGELFISFPKSLSWILSACSLLPHGIQRKISIYLKKQS